MSHPPNPPVDVPSGETPAATCQYCARPFDTERGRDMHVGEQHAEQATDAELERDESAREEERDELFFYHIKVVAALGLIYSALVIIYMAALGSGYV